MTLFFACWTPAAFIAISSIGTPHRNFGHSALMGREVRSTPDFVSKMRTVSAVTGSSLPKRRKSFQSRITATSSVPPGLSTGRVATRRRQDDSPPRIWGPKLLVSMP